MSRATQMFSQQTPPSHIPDTTNVEGYPAFKLPVEERYVQSLMTNTFGQTFYADSKKNVESAEAIHDEMLKKDPVFAAQALVYARQKGFMRTNPIFGLVKLAMLPGPTSACTENQREIARIAFSNAFNKVILTPNDLNDFTTILKSKRKGEGGRAVKRAAGNWLLEHLGGARATGSGADAAGLRTGSDDGVGEAAGQERAGQERAGQDRAGQGDQAVKDGGTKDGQYWAIKYGSESRGEAGGYSLKDMLQVYHPNARGRKVALFDYLMGRPYEGVLQQVEQFERLKKATTEAEKVAAITQGRLPHEVATSFAGSSKAIWNAIVPNLPVFALLRNLATLERHGGLEENRALIEGKLTDAKIIQKSKVLPFRFVEARKHVHASWAQDALREALELAFENIPDIPGRTVVALDRSGSMGSFIQTASVFAICLMKKAQAQPRQGVGGGGGGKMYLFDDKLDEVSVSMRDSILTQAERIQARGGTNHSLVMDKLMADRDKVDNIIYITDEAQNTGTPVINGIDRYRRTVPGAARTKMFIIDVAPYSGSLVPMDRDTYSLFGWSDQVLSFVGLAAEGFGSQVKAIRNGTV